MNHIPFGYRMEKGCITVDEEKKGQLLLLFENYLSGMSLHAAAEAAGIGKVHAQVKRMLTNERYLGDETYPALVTREMMEEARAEIRRRAVKLGRTDRKKKKAADEAKTSFRLGKIDKRYEDPFEQAAYAYSLIEEVETDG